MRSGCGTIERRIDCDAQANNGKEMAEAGGNWANFGPESTAGVAVRRQSGLCWGCRV